MATRSPASPSRRTSSRPSPGGGSDGAFEFSFDRFDCEAAPDRVFSLATYGLSPMDTSRGAGRAARALPALRAGRMRAARQHRARDARPPAVRGPGRSLTGLGTTSYPQIARRI